MTPDYEPDFRAPKGVETGDRDQLWVPEAARWSVKFKESWSPGLGPTGVRIWKVEFILYYDTGEEQPYWKPFSVLCEEDDPDSQIEDLVGWTAERTAKQISEELERRGSKLRPEDLALRQNWSVRRDLAGAWRDYRSWRKKQKESSTGKTQF